MYVSVILYQRALSAEMELGKVIKIIIHLI